MSTGNRTCTGMARLARATSWFPGRTAGHPPQVAGCTGSSGIRDERYAGHRPLTWAELRIPLCIYGAATMCRQSAGDVRGRAVRQLLRPKSGPWLTVQAATCALEFRPSLVRMLATCRAAVAARVTPLFATPPVERPAPPINALVP